MAKQFSGCSASVYGPDSPRIGHSQGMNSSDFVRNAPIQQNFQACSYLDLYAYSLSVDN